jgi:hypothetical protein
MDGCFLVLKAGMDAAWKNGRAGMMSIVTIYPAIAAKKGRATECAAFIGK